MTTTLFLLKSHGQGQRGAALIVSLILLVVMTMLGLIAIRGVTQQERMAGNSQSRNVSFQANEKALRDIETKIEATAPRLTQAAGVCNLIVTAGVPNQVMVCGAPNTVDTPRWRDSAFGNWEPWLEIGTGSLRLTPDYFVEYLGNAFSCNPNDAAAPTNCLRYRITVRSGGGNSGRARVMLQSVYQTTPVI
ncbi:MAG: pilus assembly protein [Comamonadaceae bacterium CG17_big_fil_post_rev_8_21_14_2_50_60_13]|nr:MAG: pilus assembly protein [Comamonadaceae bacterium CG17_big_fil_post_rev_8_21_14_2_50_60_13]